MNPHQIRRTKSRKSYLEKLKFDPSLNKGLLSGYLKNIRLVILLLIFIVGAGIFSYINLPRRVNPEVKIPIVFVSTLLPGAGPEDVESLVTEPLETEIKAIKGVEKITSSSKNSISAITVEFKSSADPDKARDDVQSVIDSYSGLPDSAKQPKVVALDFEDRPIWTFAISGQNSQDLPSLSRFSQRLKAQLEDLPQINKVIVSGLDEQQIMITISPEKIAQLKLNIMKVAQAISENLKAYPSGRVSNQNFTYSVSIDRNTKNLQQLRNLSIKIAKNTYKLQDIADVEYRSNIDQSKAYIKQGSGNIKNVVSFSVFKIQSANIDTAAQKAHQQVEQILKNNQDQFKVYTITDDGQRILDQAQTLNTNFLQTIALVFLTLLIFLGIKQASIASLSIPLSFLITFTGMQLMGITINFISMFSLLIALGLVVDDAIVIISAMTSYYRSKKFTPHQTGLLVWKDFIVPIWSTTITTVWAFIPLLLSTGIIGEFISTIPKVVSTTLLSSTTIAVLITLPLMINILDFKIPKRVLVFLKMLAILLIFLILLKLSSGFYLSFPIALISLFIVLLLIKLKSKLHLKIKYSQNKIINSIENFLVYLWQKTKLFFADGIIDATKISKKYEKILHKILINKKNRTFIIVSVIILFIFSISLIPLGLIENSFFPKTDQDEVYVELELADNTDINVTDQKIRKLLPLALDIPQADYGIAQVGRRVNLRSTQTQNQNNYANISIKLKENHQPSSTEIAQILRNKFTNYPDGKVKVIEQTSGPPAGADIQISILGNDLGKLGNYADKVINYLKNTPGLTNIEKNIHPGTSKITFVPDMNKLNENGISLSQLGFWLRSYLTSYEVDQAKFDQLETTDDQKIVIRFDNTDLSPSQLYKLKVINNLGKDIPISSLGNFVLKNNPTQILRENGKRSITITASVTKGFNGVKIGKNLEKFADNDLNLAPGYNWKTGGVNDENKKSVNSILQAMLLAAILILGTMVIQLNSFRKSLIVLLVIPLATSGVFIIFALTGIPLSFPALIGVLALFGIVVNNSIVVVEKINQNLKAGIQFTKAISDAAASRLEPIMFSSLTTIMGILPITLSDPTWTGLGGAIIAGLTFSGAIMLFFIPTIYYSWYYKEVKE